MPSSINSYGTRSVTSIGTTRSRKSVKSIAASTRTLTKPKWWQRRPILKDAAFTDIQKGSYIAAIYSTVESVIMIILAVFDLYCLLVAQPGSRHFRSFGISFLFVYAGNAHVRRTLIVISISLLANAIYLLVTSVILMKALRKEQENKFIHWLRAMGVFVVWRAVTILFQSVVNDLYFTYHQLMFVLWITASGVNAFAWLVVLSNYQDLCQITKLEDMAKLKMSTLSSLNASRSLSHHSLDSAYKNYVISSGPVNLQPSPYSSIGNFGGRGSTQTDAASLQQGGGGGGSRHGSQLAIQLACLNPSGFKINPNPGGERSASSAGPSTSASLATTTLNVQSGQPANMQPNPSYLGSSTRPQTSSYSAYGSTGYGSTSARGSSTPNAHLHI